MSFFASDKLCVHRFIFTIAALSDIWGVSFGDAFAQAIDPKDVKFP